MRDDGNETAGMMDCRKTGGMNGQVQTITVGVDGREVLIDLSACAYGVALNVAQARYIARKLYRMAQLAEQRSQQQ